MFFTQMFPLKVAKFARQDQNDHYIGKELNNECVELGLCRIHLLEFACKYLNIFLRIGLVFTKYLLIFLIPLKIPHIAQ